MIEPRCLHAALITAAGLAVLCAAEPDARARVQSDALARTEKAYAALESYADTGTVIYEYGTSSVSHHTFKTYFRAPRHFYFEFNEDRKDGGNRYVLWGEGEDFQEWQSDTGVHNIYPKGRGRSAFVSASYPTASVASVIPSQLFPGVGLVSVMGEIAEIRPAGTEALSGTQTQKFTGIAQSMYGTGHAHNIRRVTLWIDSETQLIRRIFQDTPKGYGTPGSRLRFTFSFEPQVNPTLDDSRFRFVPPVRQR